MTNASVAPTIDNNPRIAPGDPVTIAHVPAMDGLRTLAIGVVLAVHAGVPGFASGWLGVDLFFALSGFLITTLLLSERSETGEIKLTHFWIRRFLRLMPAYYLYVGCISLAMWHWKGSVLSVDGNWGPRDFTAALWLYFVNYAPKGGIWNGQELTVHLWSLAIEEQYYLFWPLMLSFFLRFPRRVATASWILSMLVLGYFALIATDKERAIALYARGLPLFLASAVAVSTYLSQNPRRRTNVRGSANRLLTVSLFASAIAFAVQATGVLTEEKTRLFMLPVLVTLYAVTVARLWYGSVEGIWGRVLTNPLSVYLGKISYGLYLYHQVARLFTWWATDGMFVDIPRSLAYGIRLGIYVALSIAFAALSFEFYERPFSSLRRRFR